MSISCYGVSNEQGREGKRAKLFATYQANHRVLLIVVTAIPAALMAFAGNFDWRVFIGALLGTVLAAASASVLNHVFEAHLDRRMARTRKRPLAAGRISRRRAVLFALSLGTCIVGSANVGHDLACSIASLKRHCLLCLVLHAGAKAHHPAKHRHRWCSRGCRPF